MSQETIAEVLRLNQQLLESIAAGDWASYEKLCDASITCFEAEARGHLVEGMEFHRFYFRLPSALPPGAATPPRNTTMVSPHVRLMGSVAVVSYVRLNQRVDAAGNPTSTVFEETRVWQKSGDGWKHVHFHRSAHR